MTTLILLSALAVLPINFILPSLATMAEDFGVDYGVMGLALAGYAGVSAGLQLVLGPLSDRFGRRPVILGALAIFLLATLGGLLAQDAQTFLICRFVQAVIAPAYAVALASVRDIYSREQAASKIGYIAMAWGVAPLLGPSFGGFLDELFSWRASFAFLGAFGVLMLVVCWADFRETNQRRSRSVWTQVRSYPALLRVPRFWAFTLCMSFSMGGFYCFLAGMPLAAKALFDLSPGALGLVLGMITLGFMAGSFLAGRLSGKVALARLLLVGRVIPVVGLVGGLIVVALGANHLAMLLVPSMTVGLANGLTQPSANAGALSVRPDLIGSAAGLSSAVAVGGAAMISGVVSAVVTVENARYSVLAFMLVTALGALAAALWAIWLEKQDAAAA